jgi:hypothetical protein
MDERKRLNMAWEYECAGRGGKKKVKEMLDRSV